MNISKILKASELTMMAMTLVISAALAAPQPKDGAKPDVAISPGTLVAMASIPNFPKESETACPSGADCDGMNALQRQLVEMVDADRLNPANAAETGGRAHPLKWDARLAEAALKHSEDMATRHYFSHVDPNGDTPVERVTRLGVQWRALGENIAKNFTVPAAEEAFMNEPRFENNHRGNILNPRYNYIGVGILRGPDGMVYVTQEFAQEQ
ncbi:MAG: CAP domain-containing protein [Terriglobia bacterium]